MSETKQRSPIERLDFMIESMRAASIGKVGWQLSLAVTLAIRDELVALARDRDDLQKQLAHIRQPHAFCAVADQCWSEPT